MRKLFVLAAAAAVALSAVPAFASVQNVKISGWTDNTYIYRNNFNLGSKAGIAPNRVQDEQSLFINQTGLQVDADLTDQVFVTIALITERGWNADNTTSSSDVDLHLAYVTLKEMLYSPLTLVVGRQTFSYGNGLVFDATGANNLAPGDSGINGIAQDLTKQTAIDAIRAIFDYNPLTVEVFYSKIDQNTVSLSDLDDDIDLWGVNANYQLGDDMDSVVEAYFYKSRNKEDNDNVTGAQTDYIKVTGVRASTNPLENLNIQFEMAHQGGRKRLSSTTNANRKRSAWAFQGIVNYQIPALEEYKPVAQYIFTKVTGEEDNSTSQTDWTGWDPFFEAQGGGHIYNSLFDLTNMEIHSLYLMAEPMEDVTARLGITSLWNERNTKFGSKSIRQPDGTTLSLATNNNSGHIGKEFNFDLSYDYTEDVQIGASVGWFLPGSIWESENDSSAKQVLVNMNVAF